MHGPHPRTAGGLSPSLEHYLRAIHDLEQEKGHARVTDIAERLGVAKPAVSVALRSLRASGLVDHRAYESVHLTGEGVQRAKGVSGKFSILQHFLTEVLGIRDEQAFMDACLMEHYVSPSTMGRLLDLLRFFECEDKQAILEAFRAYRRTCESDDSCPSCAFHCDIVVQDQESKG